MASAEVLQPYISRRRIQAAVRRLARAIQRDYAPLVGTKPGQELVLMGTLKGSFVFLGDLARALKLPVAVDFVQMASYGLRTSSSGEVLWLLKPGLDLRGRHVLAVEDIVDTGLTAVHLLEELQRHEPASLALCALLDKRGRRRVEVPIRYFAFVIDDVFVVGYGIDYAERYRNLPEIYLLEQEVGSPSS